VKSIPYVFTTTVIPFDKVEEAGKAYVKEVKEFRRSARKLGKELISNAVRAADDGIESIGVWDIQEGKVGEFFALQQKGMIPYHKIDGIKYRIEVRLKITEALELLGMTAPEKDE